MFGKKLDNKKPHEHYGRAIHGKPVEGWARCNYPFSASFRYQRSTILICRTCFSLYEEVDHLPHQWENLVKKPRPKSEDSD